MLSKVRKLGSHSSEDQKRYRNVIEVRTVHEEFSVTFYFLIDKGNFKVHIVSNRE